MSPLFSKFTTAMKTADHETAIQRIRPRRTATVTLPLANIVSVLDILDFVNCRRQ